MAERPKGKIEGNVRRLPTAVVVASRSEDHALAVQSLFRNGYFRFRVYTQPDVDGVELGAPSIKVVWELPLHDKAPSANMERMPTVQPSRLQQVHARIQAKLRSKTASWSDTPHDPFCLRTEEAGASRALANTLERKSSMVGLAPFPELSSALSTPSVGILVVALVAAPPANAQAFSDNWTDAGYHAAATSVGTPSGPDFGTKSVAKQSYVVGDAIAALTMPEASGGEGELTYALASPPPGLAFDPTTRQLSGTPTRSRSAGTFHYTATDTTGASATLSSVKVAATSGDTDVATVSPAWITFTTANWSTARTFTVTGANDDVDNDGRGTAISHTASGGGYDGQGGGVRVRVTDDEPDPTVTLALSPAAINESGAGNATTVTAALDHGSATATTVTVSVAPNQGASAGDVTLSANATLTIAAGETASTGTVTITAVDNSVDAPDKTSPSPAPPPTPGA